MNIQARQNSPPNYSQFRAVYQRRCWWVKASRIKINSSFKIYISTLAPRLQMSNLKLAKSWCYIWQWPVFRKKTSCCLFSLFLILSVSHVLLFCFFGRSEKYFNLSAGTKFTDHLLTNTRWQDDIAVLVCVSFIIHFNILLISLWVKSSGRFWLLLNLGLRL